MVTFSLALQNSMHTLAQLDTKKCEWLFWFILQKEKRYFFRRKMQYDMELSFIPCIWKEFKGFEM